MLGDIETDGQGDHWLKPSSWSTGGSARAERRNIGRLQPASNELPHRITDVSPAAPARAGQMIQDTTEFNLTHLHFSCIGLCWP